VRQSLFRLCHSRACLRADLSACVHAQAGKSGNPFSFVIASDRSERGNPNWQTGQPANQIEGLIGRLVDYFNWQIVFKLVNGLINLLVNWQIGQ
jgi:hypothetical protein